MVTYMSSPQNKLTLKAVEYANTLMSARVQRIENGFDTATILLGDTTLYPTAVTAGDAVKLEVKEAGGAYTTIFQGIVRFPIVEFTEDNKLLTLHCDGAGYPLGEMLVADEYGDQSNHPTLDSIRSILNNADDGIIPRFVNKVFDSATDSGYSIDADDDRIANLTGEIAYINFPYKPAKDCINDLCDLHTAISAASSLAGPHWIVDTDSQFRLKRVDGTQTGWTKYYGDSQANATLTYGVDYTKINLETLAPEANYILYYGNWRRPSNGDSWTNADCDDVWVGVNDAGTSYKSVLTEDTVTYKVGTASLRVTNDAVGGGHSACYIPDGKQAAWDFSVFSDFNVPTLNFYILAHGTISNVNVGVYNIASDGTTIDAYGAHSLSLDGLTEYDKWYHYSLPLGQYYNSPEQYQNFKWYGSGTLDWSAIDAIQFYWDAGEDSYICLDGFYFGDARICRVAYDSSATLVKMKLIVDDIGKDDTLKYGTPGTTDVGLMARLAYAELLRQQTSPLIGPVEVPMIKDALPGQWFYVQSTDFRCTKIVHSIDTDGYRSTLHLTSDTTNGRGRLRYEDLNKLWESVRPEYQDRQASNIKVGNVDIRVSRLPENYA